MPFLANIREKAREKLQQKKEQVKTGFQKFQAAEPQRARPISRRTFKSKGIVGNGLFVNNGAGLTGFTPTKRKKKSKSITVQVDGKSIKITTAKKSKKRRKPRASQGFDITNIQGNI